MGEKEKRTVALLLVDAVFSHPLFFSSLSRATFFERSPLRKNDRS